MKHLVESMRIDDFDEVMALWRKTEGVGLNESDSRENIALHLARNPDMSFVVRDENNKIIGAVLCGHDGRRGCLYHLAVEPAHRRQGIGQGLIAACLAKVREAGLTKCNILVYADNAAGKTFWERHGFSERGDLRLMQKPTHE